MNTHDSKDSIDGDTIKDGESNPKRSKNDAKLAASASAPRDKRHHSAERLSASAIGRMTNAAPSSPPRANRTRVTAPATSEATERAIVISSSDSNSESDSSQGKYFSSKLLQCDVALV